MAFPLVLIGVGARKSLADTLTFRDNHQTLEAIDTALQILDIPEKGEEGRHEAIDHLQPFIDHLAFAVIERAEYLPSLKLTEILC